MHERGNNYTLPGSLQNELDDIAAAGGYPLPEGRAEVKRFFSTAEDAAGFARKMFQRAPGEGSYTITSTTFNL
jgi:hypothetical protein